MACKYKYKDKWYSEIEVKNQLLKDISLNDVIVELSSQMSYTIEINTAKHRKEEFENDYAGKPNKIEENVNTQHYSNLTVPGGTNGSYREENFITPMIIPSIQGHAQFSTQNSIGWHRNDDRMNYTMEHIDFILNELEKSKQLIIKCD